MKKMFKKSIAMLIAVLMVISAMPFTAITAFAADSAEKSYVKANIANFNGYTGTASVSFPSGNAPSANILYANNTFQGTSNYVDHVVYNSDGPKYKFHGVQDVVLLNTNSDAYFPVSFEENDKGHSGTANRTYDYITPNTTGFETREDWVESTSWNAYDKKSGGITASGNPNYNNTDQPVYSIAKRYFVNKIYLSSSNNNTSTYYDKYDSISFKIRLDWYYNYFSLNPWGQKTGTIWDKEKTDTKYEQNKTVYVVNYKPIANKISEMKAVYNTIQQNGEGAYCADYLENFYQAAYKVMTLNPNNYPYSSGVESAVQSAAGAIKDVVDNYLTTATTEPTKHTLVDIPGKDATCGETGLTVGKKCSRCGTVTVAQTEIPATGNHTYGKAEYVNETQHKYVCSVCGTEKFEAHNIVDGKCTECDYVRLDLSTYNAAITEADGIIANSDGKYTADSVNAYKAAVDIAKAKTYSSQKEIDAIISEIQSAQALLQKARVTITFVVEKEDGTSFTKDSKTADWGQSVKLDTESDYVSKWTITVNGVTSKMYSNATFIEHVATEDATITAYVTDKKPDTKYSKVTFLGKNSAVVGIKYVAADTTVYTNTLLTVPAIPFYENGKWDKAEITADGSDITVRATYVPKAGDENKCGIHFKGDTKYYNYDSYVYLFNADKSKKYAMYADADETQLITYFDGVDFYAPRRDNLYIKEVTDTSAMTATIGFTGSYKQDTTSSFNVKFWLPEGATLVETGVDLVAKFPNGTVKSAHDRATKFSERNEYTYSAKFGESKKTIEFKPYLTYEKNGETTTVYGASQTVEY